MRRALVLVLALVGCPTAQGVDASPIAIRHALSGIERTKLEVRPSGAWAGRYGAVQSHTLTPPEQAIATRLDALGLEGDPSLSRAIRELARVAPDRVNIPAALTDGLLAHSGIVEPSPRLVVVELEDDPNDCAHKAAPGCSEAIDNLVDGVAETLPKGGELRYGVGVAETGGGATRLMVGVLEHSIIIDPLPTRLRTRSATELRARLLGDRKRPTVEVTLPNGQARTLSTTVAHDGSFVTPFACNAGDGEYQLEVLADGPHGIEVVANFPIYCGVSPPTKIVAELERLSGEVSADDVALANFHFLNETRRSRGLPLLQWDDRAAAVAEAHSRDMAAHGFVGHRSPTTGDVSSRFARAKIPATVVRENVARGYGPSGIHDSLMRSPGHRANLIATDIDKVGIGVVIGEPESDAPDAPRPVFLTQNYYRTPGAGAPSAEQLAPGLQDRVDALRERDGLAEIRWDRGLDEIAARLADARARGKPWPRGWENEVFALGHGSVESHVVESLDYEALAAVELWRNAVLHVGVGIARKKGDGAFVMIVLAVP
ncbi:MAG TPA: CAP domain-containing protein [Nannocystaceae bacterium]|nr:CAP domain-containing protein [Nannocystaceae bacterium]